MSLDFNNDSDTDSGSPPRLASPKSPQTSPPTESDKMDIEFSYDSNNDTKTEELDLQSKSVIKVQTKRNETVVVHQSFPFPKDKLGLFIGRGGNHIKWISRISGCQINISDDEPYVDRDEFEFSYIRIKGTPSGVDIVKRDMVKIIYGRK